MQTISAIDVGSNAIRLAVQRVSLDQNKMDVIETVRIPVRMGQDVFSKGTIGEPSMQAAQSEWLNPYLIKPRDCTPWRLHRGNCAFGRVIYTIKERRAE
jgi:hypothetical protein